MSNLEIKHLFKYSRFPGNEVKIFLGVVYFPVGLILLLLRSVLALFLLLFGQILPESPLIQSFLTNLSCLCFGITISVENPKKKEIVDVYISNYLFVLDHLAVQKAVGLILPLNKTPLRNLPALGIKDFGNVNNTETFRNTFEIVTKENKTPLHFCPEEAPTNGRALLKFNSKYFQYFEKVQPLCVTIKRPLDISVSTFGSSFISDVLYFMYSPFTNYSLNFLPSLEKKSLSEDDFANIVGQNIASHLKIEASAFTASEVAEWTKRHLSDERRRAQGRTQLGGIRLPNPEIARMVAQIKEVLPHVPINVIYSDLVVTRSVDTTITNILEGRVRFVPETSQTFSRFPFTTSTEASTPSSFYSTQMPPFATGASCFGKSAFERTKSFQERKEQLIANSRRQYIAKNKLDIPV